jgi:hypothetical protein
MPVNTLHVDFLESATKSGYFNTILIIGKISMPEEAQIEYAYSIVLYHVQEKPSPVST